MTPRTMCILIENYMHCTCTMEILCLGIEKQSFCFLSVFDVVHLKIFDQIINCRIGQREILEFRCLLNPVFLIINYVIENFHYFHN